mmetsp:Transcript_6817/g.18871  ORF Transcript_6817/g.18871 Transcript_6817/m.18871 type:complete len:221 (-) Transcript_6817:158-820(-)
MTTGCTTMSCSSGGMAAAVKSTPCQTRRRPTCRTTCVQRACTRLIWKSCRCWCANLIWWRGRSGSGIISMPGLKSGIATTRWGVRRRTGTPSPMPRSEDMRCTRRTTRRSTCTSMTRNIPSGSVIVLRTAARPLCRRRRMSNFYPASTGCRKGPSGIGRGLAETGGGYSRKSSIRQHPFVASRRTGSRLWNVGLINAASWRLSSWARRSRATAGRHVSSS